MDPDRTAAPDTSAAQPPIRGPEADAGPRRADRHPVRPAQRHPLEHAAARNGVRLRDDLLAAPRPLATRRGVETTACGPAGRTAAAGPTRRGADRHRQLVAPRAARGQKTGPNPTDPPHAGPHTHGPPPP